MSDRPYLDFSNHIRDVVSQGMRKAEPRTHSPFSATEAAPPAVPYRNPDAYEILRIVAEAYCITVDDITGTDKHKNISEARCVSCWLLRTRTRMSFPELGRLLSKDHTSVMVAVKRCERLRGSDAAFLVFVNKLAAAVDARLKGAA